MGSYLVGGWWGGVGSLDTWVLSLKAGGAMERQGDLCHDGNPVWVPGWSR